MEIKNSKKQEKNENESLESGEKLQKRKLNDILHELAVKKGAINLLPKMNLLTQKYWHNMVCLIHNIKSIKRVDESTLSSHFTKEQQYVIKCATNLIELINTNNIDEKNKDLTEEQSGLIKILKQEVSDKDLNDIELREREKKLSDYLNIMKEVER